MFQAFDIGYDVTSSGTADAPRPNARLHYPGLNGPFAPLWVTDVVASFGLAGQVAQSRLTRSHFPHNSNPPEILITCQAPNQVVYGRTLEFIRDHQKGLQEAYLSIPPGGIAKANYHHKGKHQSMSGYGYVQTVRRRHERFVVAPEFTFTFVISKFESKRFNDHAVSPNQMMDWSDIIKAMEARDAKVGYGEIKRPDLRTPAPDDPDDTEDASGYTKGPGRPD